jgi:C1A family cysteine protease
MTRDRPATFGWVRDLPDPRDYIRDHAVVQALYRQLDPLAVQRSKRADCSEYFLPVADQLGLSAASTHACVSLADYFERRSTGSAGESSRLFLYQT